jgi:hypothetical protein
MSVTPANQIVQRPTHVPKASEAETEDEKERRLEHHLAELGHQARQINRSGVLLALKLGETISAAQSALTSVGRDSQLHHWLKQYLPHLTLRTAERYARIARKFRKFDVKLLERFDVTALYLLAQDGTPLAARETAFEIAKKKERVTAANARSILAESNATNAATTSTVDQKPPRKSERIVTPAGIVLVKPNDGAFDVTAALREAFAVHQKGDQQ